MKPVPPPPSLKNMYKNMQNDPALKFKPPTHGDLTKWAQQGVLLLNASLTV
jgi:uracil-DNA glycosylase